MTEYTQRGIELGIGNCSDKVSWAAGHINSGTFIDIGAKIGAFFIPLLQSTDSTCIAFEPNPEAADLALRHAEINGVQNRVKIHTVALMDNAGEANLHIPVRDALSGYATLGSPMRAESKPVSVPVSTLDSYTVDNISLIKIDAEGAERYVLEGGARLIMAHHPVLIIECQGVNTRQFGYQPSIIEKMVEDMGYEWKRSGNDILCL